MKTKITKLCEFCKYSTNHSSAQNLIPYSTLIIPSFPPIPVSVELLIHTKLSICILKQSM